MMRGCSPYQIGLDETGMDVISTYLAKLSQYIISYDKISRPTSLHLENEGSSRNT